MSSFVETMAYAGDVPWHKLGTCVGAENVDGATMQRAAGLGWRVNKAPVWYLGRSGYAKVDGQYTLIRDTDGVSLGCTVGERYEPFQNDSLFECMESLRGVGGEEVRFHTAGSLMGGRKVWALAQLAGEVAVTRRNGDRDVSAPFILGYSSHDGSSCITYRLTSVRVVCWNTLSAAMGGRAPEYKVRHTASAADRMVEAAEVLGLSHVALRTEREALQALADRPMSGEEWALFCAQVLTGEDDPAKAAEVVSKSEGRSKAQYIRKGDELSRLFFAGAGNRGDCAFDALNAVTEYVDHAHGRATDWHGWDAAALDKAGESILFGNGARLKARARELLLVAA